MTSSAEEQYKSETPRDARLPDHVSELMYSR
jgi:hypothetical protein